MSLFSRSLQQFFILGLLALTGSFALAAEGGPFVFDTQEPQEMTVLSQGTEAFQRRLDMIAGAKKTIDTEYFIYALDEAGRLFSQALIKKAQEGVKVRLLIDYALPGAQLGPYFAAKLKQAGIEVRYYNPSIVLEPLKGQFRSHRKSLIVDETSAMTGGRNIADEYFDLNPKYNYLDRDILVKGTLAKAMRESFDIFWFSDLTEYPKFGEGPKLSDYGLTGDVNIDTLNGKDLARYRQAQLYYQYGMKLATAYITENAEDRRVLDYFKAEGKKHISPTRLCTDSAYVADMPSLDDKSPELYQKIKDELFTAKESIQVESPYFILQLKAALLLEGILDKGVKVSVYTNSLNSTDHVSTTDDFYPRMGPLLQHGMDIYIYRGNSLKNENYYSEKIKNTLWGTHAKTAVIDGKTILVGTFNADPRSVSINAEMAVFCRSNPELAQDILQDFQVRQASSVKLDKDNQPVDGTSKFTSAPLSRVMEYFLLSPLANIFSFLM